MLKIQKILIFLIITAAVKTSSATGDDSLLRLLSVASHDTIKIEILEQLVISNRRTNCDLALVYANKYLKISKKHNLYNEVAEACYNIGYIYKRLSNFSESLKFYFDAIENCEHHLRQQPNDETSLKIKGKTYIGIGNIYYYQGAHELAIANHIKALQISQLLADTGSLINSYISLGAINTSRKNADEAINFYNRALELALKSNDNERLSSIYNNFGALYGNISKYDSAEYYLLKSLEINKTINRISGMAYCYNNLGLIRKAKKEFNQALEYFEKGMALRKSNIQNTDYDYVTSLISMGGCYLEMKNYKKAIEYLQQGYDLSEKMGVLSEQRESSKLLGKAYFEVKNFQKA